MGIVQMVERGYVGLVDRGRVLKKWNVPRIFQLDSLSVYEKRKSSGGGGEERMTTMAWLQAERMIGWFVDESES